MAGLLQNQNNVFRSFWLHKSGLKFRLVSCFPKHAAGSSTGSASSHSTAMATQGSEDTLAGDGAHFVSNALANHASSMKIGH